MAALPRPTSTIFLCRDTGSFPSKGRSQGVWQAALIVMLGGHKPITTTTNKMPLRGGARNSQIMS